MSFTSTSCIRSCLSLPPLQFTFLSAAAICQEVYLSMRDQNHWYLVVISIPEKKVYIADCDADSEKHEIRRREATSFMVRELNLIYFVDSSIFYERIQI
ncbi:hypothetical protein LINGRAHAP2_LOCUS19649 [Linum grandiflorum]